MTIETKFALGQRLGYKLRGKGMGYEWAVGVATVVQAAVTGHANTHAQTTVYRLKFDDASKRGSWREWFDEDELEPV